MASSPPSPPADLTTLLQVAAQGDEAAAAQVYEQLYVHLRRIARARLAKGAELSLLGTTDLVNEAFLRLWGSDLPHFNDTEHFLAYVARAMRSIVVDQVRARQAARRGGGVPHVTLDTQLSERLSAPDEEVLDIDSALAALEQSEPRLAQVVELRYFGGLPDAEVAAVLSVSERTVQRDWVKARLFLARTLAQQEG